ncbi:DUF2933 domain-containing protein [Streptomyces sp. TRM49041]|uniref:DUF2933 domain-containing protein n=1 Tax=Streptomyces sp. TRM49041 TaxID=2603216 RepID=UPI0011ECE900|nr:DUF2933 domain-containing protein [Streptomyces sp. TRM49041]
MAIQTSRDGHIGSASPGHGGHDLYGRYVGGVAALVGVILVAAAGFGVPASTLLFTALAVACPLMMIVMMRAMRGGGGHGER